MCRNPFLLTDNITENQFRLIVQRENANHLNKSIALQVRNLTDITLPRHTHGTVHVATKLAKLKLEGWCEYLVFPQVMRAEGYHKLSLFIILLEFILTHPAFYLIDAVTKSLSSAFRVTRNMRIVGCVYL